MIVKDLDHLDIATNAEQISGGAYTKVQATATAIARGQRTYTSTYTTAFSYSSGYSKSS